MKALGQPAFRARQVFIWLHQKLVGDFSEMTNIPKALQEALAEKYEIKKLTCIRKWVSKLDGTVKYLFALPDGDCIESVLMRYKHGNSVCISSQVGCKMGCNFCASTIAGFKRNLTASELLAQVTEIQRDSGERVAKIVLMGIGEPLDNFENVLRFLELIHQPDGLNLSHRNISLSTCGLVDKIDQLREKDLQITLSISLHAPNNEIRNKTMPVNSRYPIEELLEACKRYTDATHRRISFEYALIDGVNDSIQNANELAHRLKGMLCHVNLIPVNAVKERSYRASRQIEAFRKVLERNRIPVTVRRTLGSDINAACGQLRREHQEEKGAVPN